MLAPAISKVREFLGSWKNLLALGTLPLLGAWIYSRVWMVNPAILGDEYLYSMNARKVGPWDPPVAGDFSNYLFNFVYQGTNLCGEAFYTCGKILNIVFFLGFVFTLFLLAQRFLPFWASFGFMIACALSPLSVYTSMFLPESMYFFFIGLVLLATLRAMRQFTWRNWALAGAAIGIASLVKPHAWLSAIAVGVTLVVVGLSRPNEKIKGTLIGGAGFALGAAIARIAVGMLIAGPKALGFFGQYFGVEVIESVVSGPASPVEAVDGAIVGAGPMAGVLGLFADQLQIHTYVIFSFLALAIMGLVLGVSSLIRTRALGLSEALALFTLIWIMSMTIEIVMFTGWVTGGGDDHTTRVLLRYYEFLFLIVPLAAIASFVAANVRSLNVFVRWGMAGAAMMIITPAFTGAFAPLSIQIADAPTLAGLVVNEQVFNAAALVTAAALVMFATFPRYAVWMFLGILPVTMIATGWQIQNQYQLFRGTESPADIVGRELQANYSEDIISSLHVLATSRFDATNVGIAADSVGLSYDILIPGEQVDPNMVNPSSELIVVVGDIGFPGEPVISGQGYKVFEQK